MSESTTTTRVGRIPEVDEFCKGLGGKRAIHSILIANNGMAAVKFIQSVRKWCNETFGWDKAIHLVAMATPQDLRINAEHIRIADQFVQVPAGTNEYNYANVRLIVEIAETTHVDAVWPGWGHASEDPELPNALGAKDIIFLGPQAASMAALGDKIGSSLLAQAAQVPTLPWSGSHVKIPPDCSFVAIPEKFYKEACVHSTEEAIVSCQTVGYPAMIKASWGGGGKGIRKVHNDEEVKAFFKQVEGEVPGSPIFIMKLASQSRHLEVQLLCDEYGNVAALHSRDCSVQRRHQKIIEEGPITVAPPETVKKLELAARRLAKTVDYVGAATVEFLYNTKTGEYFFLELNPRLQVEHPITEWISDINLVAAQVAIGMGIPLWQIPEIRRFYGIEHGGGGYDSWRKTCISATPFDFDKVESTRPKGHCVAVRVTSENPEDGFKPTSGRVEEVSFASKPNVWAYFSVKSGGGIHEFSDSQFGHVFAFGESRALAISNMVLGLKNIQIRGDIRTNVDYSIDLLNAIDFKENKFHTEWLDSKIEARVRAERLPWHISVVGGALCKALACVRATISEYVDYLEKGQIPPKHISIVTSQVSLNIEGIKYTIHMVRGGVGRYRLRLNDSEVEAEVHSLSDGGLLMQLDGNSHVIYKTEEATGTRLLIDGKTCLLQNDHDPSKVLVETPCKLLRCLVVDGSHVDAETPYAEVEVMKMCMPLLSPASGIIHFQMPEGRALQAGEVIATFDLDDPSAIKTAKPFRGSFPVLKPPTDESQKVHQQCAASLNAARMILAGYEHDIDQVVQNLLTCLDNPELPFLQWQECFAVLAKRLPTELRYELETKYKEVEGIGNLQSGNFPAKNLSGVLEAHLNSCPEKEKMALERLVEPLTSLTKSYEHGKDGYARLVVQSLFEDYLSIEELFSDNTQDDVIEHLRLQYRDDDLHKIVDIVLSHQGIKNKNKLILLLMEHFVRLYPAAYRDQLIRISALDHTNYVQVKLGATQLLELAKFNELRSCILKRLLESKKIFNEEDEQLEDFVNAHPAVEDVLISLLDHNDQAVQQRVVQTYVHRLYQPYLVKGSVKIHQNVSGLIVSWEFLDEPAKRKNRSDDEILNKPSIEKKNMSKWGAMLVVKSPFLLPTMIDTALMETKHDSQAGISSGNIMHVALIATNKPKGFVADRDEDQARENMNHFTKFLQEKEVSSNLRNAGIDIVSCIIRRDQGRHDPMRHTFHWSEEKCYYEEQSLLRHVEPPLSRYLELDKLKHCENVKHSSSCDRLWHIYTISDKMFPIQRMFLRTLVSQPVSNKDSKAFESILSVLTSGLEEIERINVQCPANMYLCILQEQQIDLLVDHDSEEAEAEKILDKLAHEIHASIGVKMYHLGVSEWEVKLWISSKGSANGAWRILVTNVNTHICIVDIYREVEDPSKNGVVYSSSSRQGSLHGTPINAQYKPLGVLDKKRLVAWKNGTTYCYDFPMVFETALRRTWSEHPHIKKPNDAALFKVRELIVADKQGTWGAPLMSVEREAGLNIIGMVAWRMEVSTPEFPQGRTILVVSNDITFKYGSFGPKEYVFFKAVSDLACKEKVPLIYLAANSGVRIEIGEDVKSCFKVGWSDETKLECGFQYIYLTPEDYARIGGSVLAHEVKFPGGESRWVIDTIITKNGYQDLSGVGAIASAFAKAYRETFTMTYVAGLNIGIGSYLARIGLRCVQRLDHPMLLTGYSALNKLLGREVYSSNRQIGGPKIMSANGVVHLTVLDDLEGISAILKWLSFVPAYIGGPLPILSQLDPLDRPIEYLPKSSCDPRATISGVVDATGKWLGGMFDRDSFVETLPGWARTAVTGRARLGGIPVGVIAVETQTMMQVFPADPALLDSHERVVPQAGQLLHTDSSTKIAQSLLDFNQEKLPLFILANWRGFSGGQRDLFEGILQAGATIVDNLRTYQQPIFIYIPMLGELQGGSWVINDTNINPDHIEIYADRTATGFILEPEGLIEIKFRRKDVLECMARLDTKLIDLKSKQTQVQNSGGPASVEHITRQIKAREKELLPLYTQIATKFAQLHCTSDNMVAKKVVKEIVDWPNSRSFLYGKLHRRIVEDELIGTLRSAGGREQLEYGYAKNIIREWFLSSETIGGGDRSSSKDDEAFLSWISDARNYDEKINRLRVQKLQLQLSNLRDSTMDLQALPQALAALLKQTDPSTRDVLIDELRKVLN